jgi:hypothetical protein
VKPARKAEVKLKKGFLQKWLSNKGIKEISIAKTDSEKRSEN